MFKPTITDRVIIRIKQVLVFFSIISDKTKDERFGNRPSNHYPYTPTSILVDNRSPDETPVAAEEWLSPEQMELAENTCVIMTSGIPFSFTKDPPRWGGFQSNQSPEPVESIILKSGFYSEPTAVLESFTWPIVRQVIDNWSELETGWDGECAEPISKETLALVVTFVDKAEQHRVREPRPTISSDGELGFVWHGQTRAAISFLPSGEILVVCVEGEESLVRAKGPLNMESIPEILFKVLPRG
jgi:hypothetical protein